VDGVLSGPPRDLVGYGRTLPPELGWPDGARVAINLVLVYEEGAEYNVLDGDDRNDGWGEYPDPGPQPPARDLGTETHYEYGSRAGVWRLARIYDAFEVPVTVSACAAALELNPAVAAWMRERGHDLLGHGWRWREPWTQSRDEERADLLRAIETFERVLGERPLGWNSRSFPSENTRELLVEEGGFLYDSDPSNDDLPYYTRCLGRPVLIVPYTKTYQDARYLVSPGFASPRDYLDTLVIGLDELLADERPAMMTVVAHARWSGQAARAAAIRAFLAHAREKSGVRFMRRLDIARWWLEQFPPGPV
jgi:peptidoglycan/xylan/chitin deacetylase (PgdA/CDA1 family)